MPDLFEATTGSVPPTALAAFAARTFPDACPPWLPREEIDRFIADELSPERFVDWLASPDARVFVALDRTDADHTDADRTTDRADATGPRITGYALSLHGVHPEGPMEWHDARTAYLSKLYVDPSRQGSGLARRLLDTAIAAAHADDCAALWLGVNDENARARAFYAKSGLTVAGRRRFSVGAQENTDDMFAIAI